MPTINASSTISVSATHSHSEAKTNEKVTMKMINNLAKEVSKAKQTANTLTTKMQGKHGLFNKVTSTEQEKLQGNAEKLNSDIKSLIKNIKQSSYNHASKKLTTLNKLNKKHSEICKNVLGMIDNQNSTTKLNKFKLNSAEGCATNKKINIDFKNLQNKVKGHDSAYNGGFVH